MEFYYIFSNLWASVLVPWKLWLVLLVLAIVFFLIRARRAATLLILLGTVWIVIWSLPITSLWLGGRLEHIYSYQPAHSLPTADAIVVLGGHTANGRANWFEAYDKNTANTRVNRAAALYKAKRANKVLLSGGPLEGGISEARGMAANIRLLGVPACAVILENFSRTTHENALLSLNELKRLGIKKVLLVTSALHMPRAMATFQKEGIHATAAATSPQITLPANGLVLPWVPNWRALVASRSIIKEYVGLFVYKIRGWG